MKTCRLILFDTDKGLVKHGPDFRPRGMYEVMSQGGKITGYKDEQGNRTILKSKPVREQIQGYCCPIILVGYPNFTDDVLNEVAMRNKVYDT